MKSSNPTTLTPVVLKLWPSNEMAEIWHGQDNLFCGNLWDYHPGCHGSKFNLGGTSVDLGSHWRGCQSLASLMANALGTKVVVKTYKRDWRG